MCRVGSRVRVAVWSAATVVVAGCSDVVDEARARLGFDEPQPASADVAPARLAVDLVPGVFVLVDGKDVGFAPVEPQEFAAGVHEVTARHSCGEQSAARVVLVDGETKTLTLADFPELEAVDLQLAVSSLHGEPLAPKLRIGRAGDPESVGDSENPLAPDGWVKLLACPQRIILESGHPNVGGYWEDIDLGAHLDVRRDIVLAPGPDVVRLPGGDFVMGMQTKDLVEIERFNHDPTNDEGEGTWEAVPQRKVRLAPFEIDRHPVTPIQLEACWNVGACRDERHEGFTLSGEHDGVCATSVTLHRTSRAWRRVTTVGMETYAANCVARWEAEKYCAWVGKRLPSSDEWEYAARSARGDWDCPSSPNARLGGQHTCTLISGPIGYASDTWKGVDPRVCKIAADRTQQGVCDFGRMDEWVREDGAAEYAYCKRLRMGPTRSIGYGAWEPPGCEREDSREARVTFRCARDAGGVQ